MEGNLEPNRHMQVMKVRPVVQIVVPLGWCIAIACLLLALLLKLWVSSTAAPNICQQSQDSKQQNRVDNLLSDVEAAAGPGILHQHNLGRCGPKSQPKQLSPYSSDLIEGVHIFVVIYLANLADKLSRKDGRSPLADWRVCYLRSMWKMRNRVEAWHST